jgi:preprotein translocase subunit SecA
VADRSVVDAVDAHALPMAGRPDAELRGLSRIHQDRLRAGADPEALLPEAFAAVREAFRRTTGDEVTGAHLVAAAVLARGHVVVPRPGDHPVLVSTPAAHLAALTGRPVHVVAPNTAEARALSEQAAPALRLLGRTVGSVPPGKDREEHRRAYAADVTYGAYTDLIHDDLREALAWDVGDLVQRGLGVAIVHGATDVLVDRSREPLRLTTGSGADRRTLAEIAVGAYFRRYERLCGLAGAADPDLFAALYGLDVVEVTGTTLIRATPSGSGPGLADRLRMERFDAVVERQRSEIRARRDRILSDDRTLEIARDMRDAALELLLAAALPSSRVSSAQLRALEEELTAVLGHPPPAALRSRHRDQVLVAAHQLVITAWDAREAELGPEQVRRIMLQVLDRRWSEHLAALAAVPAAMSLERTRGDPLDFYRRRAAEQFADLQHLIHRDTLGYCLQLPPEQVGSAGR